ncbi:MAG TPA: class I SAM-dependent methyltransferase [Dehalococcoidia bacterium]|nr:class I SAM-dependent methyltransferase [Dehalococcoidia bacterium]
MEPEEYDAMYRLEDSLWWYRGMATISRSLLERFLPPRNDLRVLDCGAGTGGSLSLLSPHGEVTAFDASRLALDLYRRRRSGRIVQAGVEAAPFAESSFDLATAFDVLYALDPEAESHALDGIAHLLRPGGVFLWREPAYMWLYGPHDVAVHGKHRYTASELRQRLQRHGLRPLRVSYANTLLFPIAVARRLAAKLFGRNATPHSDVQPVGEPLNSLLARILSLEAPLVTRCGLPFGLSVIAVARKE